MSIQRIKASDHLKAVSAAVTTQDVYLPAFMGAGRGMRMWVLAVTDVTNGVTVRPNGNGCDATSPAVTVDGSSSVSIARTGLYAFVPHAPRPDLDRRWLMYRLQEDLPDPDTVRLTAAADVPAGSVVYVSGSDTGNLADAAAAGTAVPAGLAAADIASSAAGYVRFTGVLELDTSDWDAAWSTTGGLTAGAEYFLSDASPGAGTTVAPTTPGSYLVPLGVAVSVTKFLVRPGSPAVIV